MEKLWNLSKTAVTMEFLFWWKKKPCFKKKKWGENTSGLQNVVSMFVGSVITSPCLALQTTRAIALGYC